MTNKLNSTQQSYGTSSIAIVLHYGKISTHILLLNSTICYVYNVRETSYFIASADGINEYCQHETMKARCRWKSEIIVMISARWGRMKTGRCLNIHPNFLSIFGQDPLFLGCSEDVISVADRKCSGRSECDIRIPDPELDTVTPCYPDQKSFLEASYTCVKGTLCSKLIVVSSISLVNLLSGSVPFIRSKLHLCQR